MNIFTKTPIRAPKALFVIVSLMFLSSCALWPFGKKPAENCLDDGSCEEAANPFEEQLIGGTWYCYGESRNEPWDCGQTKDDTRIRDIDTSETTSRRATEEPLPDLGERVELALNEEAISSTDGLAPEPLSLEEDAVTMATGSDKLMEYADNSFAVQLIALQTVQEIDIFAEDHDITAPFYVRIESQGSDWFVLLLDIYSSKQEADAAASVWTTTHNPNSKPWVRPIGPLKTAASRARGIAE